MVLIRYLKYLFLAAVALVLILMAFANRELVLVEVLPADLSPWLGGLQYSIELPLFIVILAAVMIGVLVGFVWEWLREHRHRSEAKTQKRTAQQLEREVATLKGPTQDGGDDILALVDESSPAH